MANNGLPPQTPQRALPGAFLTTPAPAPSIFSQNAQSSRQPQQSSEQVSQASEDASRPPAQHQLSLIDRAAKTINDTLAQESRFPALEDYVQNGVTSEYELVKSPAWNPYQPLKQYDFPTKVLEQANNSAMHMAMGMFAPLGHAWAAIDNCLYLWDYTLPNPALIGFEESRNTIEAVKLVTPKPGVFVKDITHVIVIATAVDMSLLGVAPSTTPTGAKTIVLYTTKMSIPVRALGVRQIESTKSGRIFFTARASQDIYEFDYRSDEGWFSGRSTKIHYQASGIQMFGAETFKTVSTIFGASQPPQIYQLLVDDSRQFLYTLDEKNTIALWTIGAGLSLCFTKSFHSLLQQSGHFQTRTELLTGKDVYVASLSVVPARESARIALVATTNTGCRLYIALTRGFANGVDAQNPPTQMSVTHVRLPPRDPTALVRQQAAPTQPGAQANHDVASQYLIGTHAATRLPPGYTILVLKDKERSNRDRAFLLAEDTPRLKNPQDTSALSSRFIEFGQWLPLPSTYTEMQVMTAEFGAAATPQGFGNEVAVQFDKPSLEFAIMTSSGIQIVRRKRLIDVFASVLRFGGADEDGVDGAIKKFIRAYGRGETAATSLAVACGQGLETTSDARIAPITDQAVIEKARTAFIEHGGKPEFNSNSVVDNNSAVDNVKPSPRHEGLALYMSRLLRSIWKSRVVIQQNSPGQLPVTASVVPRTKLSETQKSLSELQTWLETNKTFIEGLSGPQGLSRLSSRQEEIALQGEHRAMLSLLQLNKNIIEGISFVLTLFEERLDDILNLLTPEHKQQVLELTYEGLFVSAAGRVLAKELVKAIVNRNIAKGANVETVAEGLRRKCGSFCSADDAVVFKAQELVKRAQEGGAQTEQGRAYLNESQKYFQKVAGSLSQELIRWAVDQYIQAQFWAGAIQLCLAVAQAKDQANRALLWLRDGMPENDARKAAFEARKPYYDFVFSILSSVDQATKQNGASTDGTQSVSFRRRTEALEVINDSEDRVFQTCLYDWYINNGQEDRLLESSTPFIIEYLQRRSQQDRRSADLLWRYFAHSNQYLEAANVQFELATGFFEMSLEERIGYLGRARINASTRQAAIVESRQSKQQLLREISDRLEVANIQDDILQRIKGDSRLAPERRPEVLAKLDGPLLPVEELFNQYADQAGYHDICLFIYQCADHRNPADVRNSWTALIEQTDREAPALYGRDAAPWEAVGNKVREVGKRLNTSDAIFPIAMLFPDLQRYALEARKDKPPSTWAVDVFLDLDIPHETLLPIAETMYYSNEAPFTGSKRRVVADAMLYIILRWKEESLRRGDRMIFGSESNARDILDLLQGLLRGDSLTAEARRNAEILEAETKRFMRM